MEYSIKISGLQKRFKGFGLLSRMRVLCTCINMQFQEHVAGELVPGKHSAYGRLDEILGLALAEFGKLYIFFAANKAGVEHVFLLLFLFACNADFFRVDYNNMIAAVHIRSVYGFMAAAQHVRYFYSEASKYLIGGIDHVPFLLLLLFLCYCRIHYLKKSCEITPCLLNVNCFFWFLRKIYFLQKICSLKKALLYNKAYISVCGSSFINKGMRGRCEKRFF